MSVSKRLRYFWVAWVATMVLACSSSAFAQASYKVTDLGVPLNDGNLGCAMALNNQGWTLIMDGFMDPVSNFIGAPVARGHAVINRDGVAIDLGSLGGPNTNSWMNWGGINDRGDAVGMAETSVLDPDGEDFCGFGTGKTCLPFLWQDGHMSALPTVGGNNGSASDINNHRQIAGYAETTAIDPGCPPSHAVSPVLWEKGIAQPLPTVGDDPDGLAFAINDLGQAVGYSGTCTTARHAVLWENGTAIALPDLGFQRSNVASGINNQGQIVGRSRSADGTTFLAVLWQNGTITNLRTLPGDFASWATGINSQGQVVGSTLDSHLNWSHAFIYQNHVMTDLNKLFPEDSNLLATMANKINDRGQISGMATVRSGPHAGEIHAFLATPVNATVGTSIADIAPTHP